jgi:hypothetical protein
MWTLAHKLQKRLFSLERTGETQTARNVQANLLPSPLTPQPSRMPDSHIHSHEKKIFYLNFVLHLAVFLITGPLCFYNKDCLT